MVLPYGYNQAADRGGQGRKFYERNLASIMGDPRYARYRQDAGFQDAARDYAALWIANAQQGGRVKNTGFDFSGVDLSPYRHNGKAGTFWREGYFQNKGFGNAADLSAGKYALSPEAQRYFSGSLDPITLAFYQRNPELGYQAIADKLDPDNNSMFSRFVRAQSGDMLGDFLNFTATPGNMNANPLDYFAKHMGGLRDRFGMQDARSRGETPGLFGNGYGGMAKW